MNKSMLFLIFLCPLVGCGTTRVTDTQRTATEQLLVSDAVDQAVSQLDFRSLSGKPVYFDPQYLEGTVDRGYVISSLRQQLLSSGAILIEDRTKAIYVVEARAGGVGTDRHSLLLGVPQMNVPTLLPGQPYQIPEIPLAKKTDQKGVAKIGVFAYNRLTGRPVWQSGIVHAASSARDTWVLGLGPFQRGTIRDGTEFAGQALEFSLMSDKAVDDGAPAVPVTQSASWSEPPWKPDGCQPPALLTAMEWHLKSGAAGDASGIKPLALSPPPANPGGKAETAPMELNAEWAWPNFKPDFMQQMHDLQGRARQFPTTWLPDHAMRQ